MEKHVWKNFHGSFLCYGNLFVAFVIREILTRGVRIYGRKDNIAFSI